ncbi:MAG: cupredoxin domain-containing protein [Patescibacteria group bacterium]
MDTSNKKNIIIYVVVAIIVVAIVVYALMSGGGSQVPGLDEGKVGEKTDQGTVTEKGIVAAPGTSAISTSTGKVVTNEGIEVKNDVVPGTPQAPQQSNPVAPEALPSAAIKLDVSASGYAPNQFTVKAGAPVTLSVTASDNQTHIFMFDDASLSAVAIGVAPKETRAITFNAPTSKGEYTFKCDVPGHAGRGETGKMIVN